MKLGILSDAHGNLTGLNACLDHLINVQKSDQIVFLGDIAGYYPDVNNVIRRLKEVNASCLLGNHDAMILERLASSPANELIYRHAEQRELLVDADRNFLESLPDKKSETFNGKKILFVHGSPADPLNGYIYPDSDITPLASLGYDMIFSGHTHHPCITIKGSFTYVNVGSCGLPRDNGLLTSCCCLDTDNLAVEIFRIRMDKEVLSRNYGSKVHPSVLECLERTGNNIFGTII